MAEQFITGIDDERVREIAMLLRGYASVNLREGEIPRLLDAKMLKPGEKPGQYLFTPAAMELWKEVGHPKAFISKEKAKA